MKRFIVFLVVALALAIGAIVFLWPSPQALRVCIVTGDVENNVSLADIPLRDYAKVPEGGRGIPLVKLIEASKPLSSEYSILLMGADGLVSKLNGDELGGCYFVKKDGSWNTVATQHPAEANIKDLSKIVIVDETMSPDLGATFISQTENLLHITAGNMHRQQLSRYLYLQGETALDRGYSVSLYKEKLVLPVANLTDEEVSAVLVMSRDGEYERFTGGGYIELNNNEINYLHPRTKTSIGNIAGAIINPPSLSVMDAYTDSLYYLNNGERVMVIVIDGFGYHQYEYARDKALIPNIMSLGPAAKANTVYTPVTNAGLGAIVSGQPPAVSGIIDSVRQPKVQTIFDILEGEEKTHVLVAGSTDILQLNTETILSPDLYNDGTTDDDVFGNAMAQAAKHPDYLLVHFHGVDDAGHNYGPLAAKTMDALEAIDAYVGLLLQQWPGKAIILSDHGMHYQDVQGDHGLFQAEDMFVPYIIN